MPVRRPRTRPAPSSTLGHAQAQERPAQSPFGRQHIRLLMPSCQRLLGATARLFRSSNIDLLGMLGGIGEYRHLVIQYLEESTGDEVRARFRALPPPQLA